MPNIPASAGPKTAELLPRLPNSALPRLPSATNERARARFSLSLSPRVIEIPRASPRSQPRPRPARLTEWVISTARRLNRKPSTVNRSSRLAEQFAGRARIGRAVHRLCIVNLGAAISTWLQRRAACVYQQSRVRIVLPRQLPSINKFRSTPRGTQQQCSSLEESAKLECTRARALGSAFRGRLFISALDV